VARVPTRPRRRQVSFVSSLSELSPSFFSKAGEYRRSFGEVGWLYSGNGNRAAFGALAAMEAFRLGHRVGVSWSFL